VAPLWRASLAVMTYLVGGHTEQMFCAATCMPLQPASMAPEPTNRLRERTSGGVCGRVVQEVAEFPVRPVFPDSVQVVLADGGGDAVDVAEFEVVRRAASHWSLWSSGGAPSHADVMGDPERDP
jgi:hypothetical protein